MRLPTLKESANPTTGPGRSAARRATAALCEQGTLSVCYPHEAVTAVREQRSLKQTPHLPRSDARTAALAPVSACCSCFGGGGIPTADAAELCQPLGSGEQGGKETGYAQIEVQAFPVQATAAPKNFNRTEILGSGSVETRNQLYRQRNRRPVRELDPQCTLLGAVGSKGSSRFCFCSAAPSAGGPREIRAQLLLYPARYQV